jgi:hypothetical protein
VVAALAVVGAGGNRDEVRGNNSKREGAMRRRLKQFHQQEAFAFKFLAYCVVATAFASHPASRAQTSPKTTQSQPSQQQLGKSFASPEDASAALYIAASKNDENALATIFGPDSEGVVHWSDNPKDRQDDSELFALKYLRMRRFVKEPDGTVSLYVGAENWPFPIPLVEKSGAWYFDTDAGKKEILYRRIGKNEMEAMEVCRALADSEKDYYAAAHQYAQNFISAGSARGGLYWPVSNSTASSLIGPYLAHAGFDYSTDPDRKPYHGYYYRILVRQGPMAPGGARDYMINGQMTGGFAILAFPAQYRSSGVMTFILGQDGVMYEKDLGPMTDELALKIDQYNPDNTWKRSLDESSSQ